MRAVKSTDEVRTAVAMRDRVTVDLRGIRPQLQAQAAKRQMTAAALVRRAVMAMLDEESRGADDSRPLDSAGGTQAVKVTLRLSASHAVVLASRARMADVSQGTYVARLIDGTPAQPLAPDHTRAVAALMASTDRLAALSADLNAFMRLLVRTPKSEVGFEVARRARHGRPVHPGFKFIVVQALGGSPVHAGHARHADDGADGGLGDAQHASALAQAQAGFEVETKGLS